VLLIILGPNIILINREQINKISKISIAKASVPKTLKEADRK
tara:strand:+ start:158 stop:283 length:126 start_codon:yes stop_codon:yes gene_type:complete